MRLAIALTLAFFAVVSGMGTYRDLLRVMRDPRPARYLGVIIAAVATMWSLYAAYWIAAH
jgi:hypothetical protein